MVIINILYVYRRNPSLILVTTESLALVTVTGRRTRKSLKQAVISLGDPEMIHPVSGI